MTWHDASAFFAMGGYGAYVWGAYALTALALGADVAGAARRRRRALAAARRA